MGGSISERIGGLIIERIGEIGGAKCFPDSRVFWDCLTVDLCDVELRGGHDRLNRRRGFIDEDADFQDMIEALAQRGGHRRGHVSRTLRVRNKTERRCARLDCCFSILPPRDPADLNHHDRNSRNAAAGSADFIKCSPTRKALYPLNFFTSAEEFMPLSVTLITPEGIFSASRKEVSSVTSNVCRFRLFTPTICAPDPSARSSSASSCTSTRALIP